MSAPAFASIGTLHGAATSTPAFAVPSGVSSGDIILVVAFLDTGTVTVTGLPSGFSQAENSPVSQTSGTFPHKLMVAWKRATGADTGTYDFTLSASVFVYGNAIRYTGCVASGTPIDTGTGTGDSGSSSVTSSPAVSNTTAGPDRLQVHVATNWNGDSGTWSAPSGYTLRTSGGANITNVAASDVAQPAQGNSGSVSATSTASGPMAAWIGALIGTTTGGGATDVSPQWMPGFMIAHDGIPSALVTGMRTPFSFPTYDTAAPAGVELSATANLAVTVGLSGDVVYEAVAVAPLAVTAGLSAAVVLDIPVTTNALAVTAGLSGTAALTIPVTSNTLAVTVGLSGAEVLAIPVSANLAVTVGFSAAASTGVSAPLAVTVGLSAAATVERFIIASLAVTAGFSASETLTIPLAASLVVTVARSTGVVLAALATATLPVVVGLIADATRTAAYTPGFYIDGSASSSAVESITRQQIVE